MPSEPASAHAYHPLIVRDPAPLLEAVRSQWQRRRELWVFGYGSLIWRPGFRPAEQRVATVHGYHRALRMRSRINRGSPERPGLVFALLRGGSCRGVALRVAPADANAVLDELWAREMPTGVYDTRWLPCRTAHGSVHALAFTLNRRSPSFCEAIDDAEMLDILRHAEGRYGSTLDYLLQTERGLRHQGIHDREVERLVAFAKRHALPGCG